MKCPRPAPSASARRILLVEDDADTLESTRILLDLLGHHVACANNGASAVRVAKAFRPEVVLLDIGLPDMNGYEVARWLQTLAFKPFIIALTGYGMPVERERAIKAGCDLHLLKPVEVERLDHAIRSAPSFTRTPPVRFRYPVVRPSKRISA